MAPFQVQWLRLGGKLKAPHIAATDTFYVPSRPNGPINLSYAMHNQSENVAMPFGNLRCRLQWCLDAVLREVFGLGQSLLEGQRSASGLKYDLLARLEPRGIPGKLKQLK
jgi:hypothetical protein